MSSDAVVRARGLSKCYQIYDRPKDRLKQMIGPRVARLLGRDVPRYYREFWAVRDVSLEVGSGEAVGVIGRNGSGKSTLLQMICGTLQPTQGTVEVNGRVAALLELGAGFNPEFTGRENVYLAASLYGLTTEQVDARYDAIAAFADIGRFLDQPVKTYSSGMFVRLAFAVVANVDADVLVVDEALAVGDAVFTQKCMRFIRRFRETRCLLFVSHDMSAVMNLCDRALWLADGSVRAHGPAEDVTKQYMLACLRDAYGEVELQEIAANRSADQASAAATTAVVERDTRVTFLDNLDASDGFQSGGAEIIKIEMLNEKGDPVVTLAGGEHVCLRIVARVLRDLESPIIGFLLKDRLGQALFGENTFPYAPPQRAQAGDTLDGTFQFRLPLLPNGDYAITAAIADGTPLQHVQQHWLHDAVLIKVASTMLRHGLVGIPFERVTLVRTTASELVSDPAA